MKVSEYESAMHEECVVLNGSDPFGEPFIFVVEVLCYHFYEIAEVSKVEQLN